MSHQNIRPGEDNSIDIDENRKQKIINQLRNEVESLKAKYILDEKSKGISNQNIKQTNNTYIPNQNFNTNFNNRSDEFRKTIPQKHEMQERNYNPEEYQQEENYEFEGNQENENYLEKNDSIIIEENQTEENRQPHTQNQNHNHNEERDLNNLYPKEYKRENLNLENINEVNLENKNKKGNFNDDQNSQNNYMSQSYKQNNKNIMNNYYQEEKDSYDHHQSHSLMHDNPNLGNNKDFYRENPNEKVVDYDIFDKAKENLIRIRNDLDELDKYDINKNKRNYNFVGNNETNTNEEKQDYQNE